MRYRQLSPTGDYVFGNGSANFLINTPATVAQAVQTRLNLLLGEWFLDTSDGTDWFGSVLGKYTSATRDMILKERILGTPNVTGIVTYASEFSSGTRQFAVQGTIDTAYGQTTFAVP